MTHKKVNIFNSREARRNLILCIIAIAIAVFFLFPLYWLISMSFKSDAESFGKYRSRQKDQS